MNLIWILRISLYIWAVFELGLLTSLYGYAASKSKDSRVIRALFLFLIAISVSVIYRFLWNYSSFLDIAEDTQTMLRNMVMVPLLFITMSARRFRKLTLNPNGEDSCKHLEKKLSIGNDIIKKSK